MDVFRAFQDPHLVHATVVHFPVALGVLGFPLLGIAAVTKMKPTLRQIVLALYLLLAVAAFASTTTGSLINEKPALPDVTQSLEMHSLLAGYVWIGAMATAVLVLLTAVRSEWFRAMFSMLGVLASAGTTALIVATAFFGQSLVYDHGLGTKTKPPVQASAPQPPPVPQVKPAPPVAVAEPEAAAEAGAQEKELESVAPPAPLAPAEASTGQPKTVETLNNEAVASLKSKHIPRIPFEKPTQTYTERAKEQFGRAKRWVYKYMWPL